MKDVEFIRLSKENINIISNVVRIDNEELSKQDIEKGDTVEIPIDTEYAFKGKMKMIEIMNPPFEPSTHIDTRKNDL